VYPFIDGGSGRLPYNSVDVLCAQQGPGWPIQWKARLMQQLYQLAQQEVSIACAGLVEGRNTAQSKMEQESVDRS